MMVAMLARYVYDDVVEKKYNDLNQFNTLIKEGWVESRLFTQESVVQSLGDRLIDIGVLKNIARAQLLLESILKNSTNVMAIGLSDARGQLLVVTHKESNGLPDLLENDATKESFKQALLSDHMVLGHTYYSHMFEKWILPMHLPISELKVDLIEKLNAFFKVGSIACFRNIYNVSPSSVLKQIGYSQASSNSKSGANFRTSQSFFKYVSLGILYCVLFFIGKV